MIVRVLNSGSLRPLLSLDVLLKRYLFAKVCEWCYALRIKETSVQKVYIWKSGQPTDRSNQRKSSPHWWVLLIPSFCFYYAMSSPMIPKVLAKAVVVVLHSQSCVWHFVTAFIYSLAFSWTWINGFRNHPSFYSPLNTAEMPMIPSKAYFT